MNETNLKVVIWISKWKLIVRIQCLELRIEFEWNWNCELNWNVKFNENGYVTSTVK